MKMFAAAVAMQLGWTLYPPLSEAQPALSEPSPALKQCIVTYASGVEQNFTSLSEGADFLVQKVCVAQAAMQLTEAARERAEAQKKKMAEACKAAADKKDNLTDGIRQDPTLMGMCNNPMMDIFSDTDWPGAYYAGVNLVGDYGALPGATSLAAQTLLQLRMERLKQKK